MELNVDTVLAAMNDVHARTGKRVFTLIEIAEALSDGQRVTPPGRHGPTDAEGNPILGMSRQSRPGSRRSIVLLLRRPAMALRDAWTQALEQWNNEMSGAS